MAAAAASVSCVKCGRTLNARMKGEGDRVPTYWKCLVCDQEGEGSSRSADPAAPPQRGVRHSAAPPPLERPLDVSPGTLSQSRLGVVAPPPAREVCQ